SLRSRLYIAFTSKPQNAVVACTSTWPVSTPGALTWVTKGAPITGSLITNKPACEWSLAPDPVFCWPMTKKLPSAAQVWDGSSQPPKVRRAPPDAEKFSGWFSDTVPGAPSAPALSPCDAGPVVIKGTDSGCAFDHQMS